MKTLTLVLVVVLVTFAVAVLATPALKATFDKTYHPKAGTALAKAGCVTCHTKMGSTQLNSYGMELKGKPMTAASLKSIEKMDADKDGASNITEIKAGTLPGDGRSKPAAAKPMKPKAAPKKK
jgi:mono/diheme cytochrome c family protein